MFNVQLRDIVQWSEKTPALVKKKKLLENYLRHDVIDALKIKMA